MKKIFKWGSIVLGIIVLYVAFFEYPKLEIITGYSAKSVASGVFIGGRTQVSVEKGDNDFSLMFLATNKVDKENGSVSSSIFGMQPKKAVFREGLGSILITEAKDGTSSLPQPNRNHGDLALPYPYGNQEQKDTVFSNVDYESLSKEIERIFDVGDAQEKRTRSVLVLYKDQVIGEKYAAGFDRNTPILGWSMTKSITSAIYGVMVKKGMLDINDSPNVRTWSSDDRKEITYNDLLHMNSGLEWEENYYKISDVTRMLYHDTDMGQSQIDKPLVGKPDETWNYSSGTTNVLAGPLMSALFENKQEYMDFWYKELIDKIGMSSALIETDQVGHFVGSSYGWATTRDWGKFGTLYLHEGNWNGEQVLDSSWVAYTHTPTNGSEGRYGAQFWLNAGGYYPDAPRDLYSCNGFQGQRVFIVPSKELVIVRMGLTEDDRFDFNAFLKNVIDCIN